ncbi:urease accessory protein, partial [Actinomadura luteofluorescens]
GVAAHLSACAARWRGGGVGGPRTDSARPRGGRGAAPPPPPRVARAALAVRDPRELHGSVPVADVVSAAHERAEARLFVT